MTSTGKWDVGTEECKVPTAWFLGSLPWECSGLFPKSINMSLRSIKCLKIFLDCTMKLAGILRHILPPGCTGRWFFYCLREGHCSTSSLGILPFPELLTLVNTEMQELLPKLCILGFFLWLILYLLKLMLHPDEKNYNSQAENVKFASWLWEVFMGNSFQNPKLMTEM